MQIILITLQNLAKGKNPKEKKINQDSDKLLLSTKTTHASIVCSYNSLITSLSCILVFGVFFGFFGVPIPTEFLSLLSPKLHLPCFTMASDTLPTLCCINYIIWICLKLKQVAQVLFSVKFRPLSMLPLRLQSRGDLFIFFLLSHSWTHQAKKRACT